MAEAKRTSPPSEKATDYLASGKRRCFSSETEARNVGATEARKVEENISARGRRKIHKNIRKHLVLLALYGAANSWLTRESCLLQDLAKLDAARVRVGQGHLLH